MASSQRINEFEPDDDNRYSSFGIQGASKDDVGQNDIKNDPLDDGESLFIPNKPAPTPVIFAELAFCRAPSSRTALTSPTMPKPQDNLGCRPSTSQSTPTPISSNSYVHETIAPSRLSDSNGKEAPTECFEGRLRNDGFQHRLICGHVVVTNVRQPCGTKCKLQTGSAVKPANRTSIDCPHPACVSLRQSMMLCFIPRKPLQRNVPRKFSVVIVPENGQGNHLNLDGLSVENTTTRYGTQRPMKKIKNSSAVPNQSNIPPVGAADLAAEARLIEQLAAAKYNPAVKRLALNGVTTVKSKQPAGCQMEDGKELQERRRRRQFTQDLNSGMFSMPENDHDELVKAVPSLIVDRELDDYIGSLSARAEPSDHSYLNEEDTDDGQFVDSIFNSEETDEHCVCEQAKDHTMLECDSCKKLFHASCIGKGLSTPGRYKSDPDMCNAADAKHWRAQDNAFSCRDCDIKGTLAHSTLGSKKRKHAEIDIDSEDARLDLTAGKMAKLKECNTAADRARVQQVWSLLYSSEEKLDWNDFMCAKCDQHITGTRYHCSACFLFDLCEACMRKGRERPCPSNSCAYNVYYAQAKEVEMGGM